MTERRKKTKKKSNCCCKERRECDLSRGDDRESFGAADEVVGVDTHTEVVASPLECPRGSLKTNWSGGPVQGVLSWIMAFLRDPGGKGVKLLTAHEGKSCRWPPPLPPSVGGSRGCSDSLLAPKLN